ncbi:hypothetical protein BAUCODRAFT_127516 [Baudoinia panamericana UAMH 10762]|uniref:Uncharacterized protein n=1 Tax=Baudoinia panamericana (strain UAMH 10762) TaxID=717646 RepID=M2LAJ3_BAUPA|nr:uncharacterized protein BAUCODRAFT_127516 [Baudoinia panamericana UAMH 10762]EMC90832.1 hypothetical protein BAUCODRAFT_127516 [Baudoinia panamericana UAMH 10762]
MPVSVAHVRDTRCVNQWCRRTKQVATCTFARTIVWVLGISQTQRGVGACVPTRRSSPLVLKLSSHAGSHRPATTKVDITSTPNGGNASDLLLLLYTITMCNLVSRLQKQ